jgi:CubicO group peptidase (beta-lactamase class C family)
MPTTSTTTTTEGGVTSTQTVTVSEPEPAAAAPLSSAIPGDPLALIDPSLVGMCPARLGKLEAMIKKMIADEHIPFGRVKVMRHGRLVADVTVNSALGTQTEDSIYRYYSMTKVVASVVCMIAVERGLMRLDDPIEKYIPEFRDVGVYKSGTVEAGDVETEPPAAMPTVRMCLQHTAGFGYGGLFGAFGMVDEVCKSYIKAGCGIDMLGDEMFKRFPTLEDLARTMAKMPLRHQPGTMFDYGMGHIISGRCCEVGREGKETIEARWRGEGGEGMGGGGRAGQSGAELCNCCARMRALLPCPSHPMAPWLTPADPRRAAL